MMINDDDDNAWDAGDEGARKTLLYSHHYRIIMILRDQSRKEEENGIHLFLRKEISRNIYHGGFTKMKTNELDSI